MNGPTPCNSVSGRPAAYVCENFSCRMPVTDPEALEPLLQA